MNKKNLSLLTLLSIGLTGPLLAQEPPHPPQKEVQNHEKMKRFMAIRSTAEAYKNLADMQAASGKTDEAIGSLKKILELTSKFQDPEEEKKLREHIANVYLEMAEIYMKADRKEDAKTTLQEGLGKIKGAAPEMAGRFSLMLGNIYRKEGNTAEAEKLFRSVIEQNAAVLEKK